MKSLRLNLPFVANRIEAIDFKTFCEGGSPEYVAAKKKLKNLHLEQQQESKGTSVLPTHLNRRNITAYSLYINPLAFFDIHFALAAGAVVLVAVLEKKLAENGIVGMAAALSGVLRIALPVVAFGSAVYLISQLGVFL